MKALFSSWSSSSWAAGLMAAGVRLPFFDYPIGILDGRGPGMPDVQIEATGFQ